MASRVMLRRFSTIWKPVSSRMLRRGISRNMHLESNPQKVITNPQFKKQRYDYFLVVDFEATCEKNVVLDPQEIIEFPCLKVSATTFEIESEFHEYVRPLAIPTLSHFCTELTGIVQDMVDDRDTFTTVFERFNEWLKTEKLLEEPTKFIVVSCGDWDMLSMLPRQCEFSKIAIPEYLASWINIKQVYAHCNKHWPKTLKHLLKGLDLSMEGRLHSGIADCRNIARALRALAERGIIFKRTGLKYDKDSKE